MPKRLAITGLYLASVLDYDDRPLAADEILVKTEIASGKHGATFSIFDYCTFEDKRFDVERHLVVDDGRDWSARSPSIENPWNTGTSGLGIVEAVGANVDRFVAGDRVFGLMDIRETNILHQSRLWRLGDIDPLLALCIEPAYVSIHFVRESNLRYGDRVAVIGLGALGLLAVCIARETGAESVFAVDLLPNRRALATEYGADHTLDPRDNDLLQLIRERTDGMGVDIAIELSGAYAGLNTAIACTRVGRLVCSAGFYRGGEANNLFLDREYHHNRLTMIVPHGCGWGHEPRDYPYWHSQRAYDAIVAMTRRGRLQAPGLVNKIYSLPDAVNVFQDIKRNTN